MFHGCCLLISSIFIELQKASATAGIVRDWDLWGKLRGRHGNKSEMHSCEKHGKSREMDRNGKTMMMWRKFIWEQNLTIRNGRNGTSSGGVKRKTMLRSSPGIWQHWSGCSLLHVNSDESQPFAGKHRMLQLMPAVLPFIFTLYSISPFCKPKSVRKNSFMVKFTAGCWAKPHRLHNTILSGNDVLHIGLCFHRDLSNEKKMVSHGVPWCPISTASRSTEALGLKDLLFRDTLELKNTSAQGDT